MRARALTIGSGLSMGVDAVSQGVDLQYFYAHSIQAYWTGSPVGTFKLQVSNDTVVMDQEGIAMAGGYTVPTSMSSQVVNWSDYTGTLSSTTVGSPVMWNSGQAAYRWVRVAYTAATASGTLTVNFFGKGV